VIRLARNPRSASVAHASRVLAIASRNRGLSFQLLPRSVAIKETGSFRRNAETDAAVRVFCIDTTGTIGTVEAGAKGHFGSSDMRRLLRPGRKRNLFLACLRGATFCLLFALTALFMAKTPPLYAGSQVTLMPPFVGTHSETWEEFGKQNIPSGTSILGGIATISGTNMVTAHSFIMCTVVGKPSDGTILMDSDRPNDLVTISFSQPVSAFGAYWGSGYRCRKCCGYPDAPSILTFQDVNGNVIGTDSFFYQGDGTLMWRGYSFGTPVKTITRTAGDGQEGVAMDGLQATVASNSENPAWSVVGVADFNRDGHPDYLLFNSSTRQTAIWYLNNNVFSSGLFGPALPAG
jgi:hypothetical protein